MELSNSEDVSHISKKMKTEVKEEEEKDLQLGASDIKTELTSEHFIKEESEEAPTGDTDPYPLSQSTSGSVNIKDEIKEEVPTSSGETYKGKIFQFKITLLLGKSRPKIWRRFQVPSTYTFRQFHIAIQKVMGWKSVNMDYHLHAFELVNPSTSKKETITVFPDDYDNGKNENNVLITNYYTKKGQKTKYEYDFGMCWEHDVVFEKEFDAVEGETYPKCIDGAKACPPEDGNEPSDEEYDSDRFDPNACS